MAARSKRLTRQGPAFHERQAAWDRERRQRQEQAAARRAAEEMFGATFAPEINPRGRRRSTSPLGAGRGAGASAGGGSHLCHWKDGDGARRFALPSGLAPTAALFEEEEEDAGAAAGGAYARGDVPDSFFDLGAPS